MSRPPGPPPFATVAARRWRGWLGWIVALAPAVWVADVVQHFAVPVPHWDSWELVPLLDKHRAGALTLGDLWAQHNEHRIFLPRILMLALADRTGWDPRAEMAASLVLAVCTLVLLGRLVGRTVGPVAPALVPWLVAASGWIVFSMAPWENWIWGWQVQIVMTVTFAVAFAAALERHGASWRGVAGMAAAAAGGMASFTSGLVLVLLLPVVVFTAAGDGDRWARLLRTAAAAAFSIACLALYLADFAPNPYHPSPWEAVQHPGAFAHYIVAYTGAAIDPLRLGSATLWGAGAIVVLLGGFAAWLRGSGARRRRLAPWLVLGLYGVANGAVTGVGRLGFGVEQALASRYTTITAPLWVSVLVLAAMGFASLTRRATVTTGMVASAIGGAVFVLGLQAQVGAWTNGLAGIRARRGHLRRAIPCLRDVGRASDDCLRRVYPLADDVRARMAVLDRLGIRPF